MGFYVNWFVEAESEDEAKRLAISMIRELPRLRATLPPEMRDALAVDVDRVSQLEDEGQPPEGGQGLIFYPEKK